MKMAFRHIWAVGKLAERTADKQAQKAFSQMVYTTTKRKVTKADKAKK